VASCIFQFIRILIGFARTPLEKNAGQAMSNQVKYFIAHS